MHFLNVHLSMGSVHNVHTIDVIAEKADRS